MFLKFLILLLFKAVDASKLVLLMCPELSGDLIL